MHKALGVQGRRRKTGMRTMERALRRSRVTGGDNATRIEQRTRRIAELVTAQCVGNRFCFHKGGVHPKPGTWVPGQGNSIPRMRGTELLDTTTLDIRRDCNVNNAPTVSITAHRRASA